MQIRRFEPQDMIEFHKLAAVAFLQRADFTGKSGEQLQEGFEKGRGAFCDGRMQAALLIEDYTVNFDGHRVPMGGIAGVASRLESRRQGAVRRLMRFALEEMYERGVLFSYLFPFSYPYYRQYGYEYASGRQRVEAPMPLLAPFKAEGELSMYEPGNSLEPYKALFNGFCAGQNLSIVRDDAHWKRLFDFVSYRDTTYAYLLRDEQGAPCAYVRFTANFAPGGGTMDIHDLYFNSTRALLGLLGHLRSMDAQVSRFTYTAPTSLPVHQVFKNPDAMSLTVEPGGMCRVINAAKALELMRIDFPILEPLIIRVFDDFMPWNDGAWAIESDGSARSVRMTAAPGDVQMNICTFSQLVVGSLSLEQSMCYPDLKVNSPHRLAELSRLFPQKPTFVPDKF